MKPAAIVTGTLGLGTALVFGAAMLASAMFPNGGTVNVAWNGGMGFDKGFGAPVAVPAPGVIVNDGTDLMVPPDVASPQP